MQISKDDKMPQTVCITCIDKINNFYDFREICHATNIQTRKLLGLKNQFFHENSNRDNNSIYNIGRQQAANKSGLNINLDLSLSMENVNTKDRKRKYSDEMHEREDIVLQPLTNNRNSRSPISPLKRAKSTL